MARASRDRSRSPQQAPSATLTAPPKTTRRSQQAANQQTQNNATVSLTNKALCDEELDYILGKWRSYEPTSRVQVGNTVFMKSEINDIDPVSLGQSYNAWQLKLQITWLLEYRGQQVAVPRTKAAMIQMWIDLVKSQAAGAGSSDRDTLVASPIVTRARRGCGAAEHAARLAGRRL
jgi:hypothetical protein